MCTLTSPEQVPIVFSVIIRNFQVLFAKYEENSNTIILLAAYSIRGTLLSTFEKTIQWKKHRDKFL